MTRRPAPEPCPNLADHTPCPAGYIQWHEWAAEMTKTHRAIRCTGCDLYTIWVPKDAEPTTLTTPRRAT